MLEETLANGNVFKRDESWSHVVKKINLKTYVIEYNIVSGFKNKEEALDSYRKEEAKYKKGIDKIKKLTDMPCTFVEYLDSWYQDSVFLDGINELQHILIHGYMERVVLEIRYLVYWDRNNLFKS